jgi:O-antigen/teichoic acid export membrane protein
MGLKRDSIVSLIGTISTAVVMLVSIPLLLHKIGDARFGTLTLVWLLAGYAGLLDFGLSRATARDIARTEAVEDHVTILWSAVWVSALIGLIVGLAGYVFSAQLLHLFASSAVSEGDLAPIIPWIAALVPLALVNGVFVGTLEGRKKFIAVNIGQVLTTILMQAFPTITAYWVGPELRWIVPAAVLARLISTMLLLAVTLVVAVAKRPRFIDWRVTRRLFASGTWFSLASVLGSLFATADKFFIASLIGASAVAHYSVPESAVRRASLVPLAMVRPLFPRLASLDDAASHQLAQRALELVILIITPIVVVTILSVRIFLRLWVGEEFSQVSAPIGALIALGLWFNSLAFIPDAYLQGRGRASISVLCSIIELVPHMLLLYVGLKWFGLMGGATALFLITVLDLLLLSGFSGLTMWKLKSFWVGCSFASVAYITSALTFPPATTIMIYGIEITAVTAWSLILSKDLQALLLSLRARAGLALRKGAA